MNDVKLESSWKRPNSKFWLKQLTAIHAYLTTLFNKLIEEGQIPDWLTTGLTFLIANHENLERPKNYRPITCLPTIHKTITSIISIRIKKYIGDRYLMPKEHKRCCRGSKNAKISY